MKNNPNLNDTGSNIPKTNSFSLIPPSSKHPSPSKGLKKMQKPVSKDGERFDGRDELKCEFCEFTTHHSEIMNSHIIFHYSLKEKGLKPAPKLTPIDSIDLEVTYGEIWLNDKTVVVADAIKALADKVNEIIVLINEERR